MPTGRWGVRSPVSSDSANVPRDFGYVSDDIDTLADSLAVGAGVTGGGTTRRGKSIIATEQTTTSTSFTTLSTPDQVASIVLPTDGLIFVLYQALWKNTSTGGAGARAAIFIGSNQLKIALSGSAPAVQAASYSSPSITQYDVYSNLSSFSGGLIGDIIDSGAAGSHVTTGQLIGITTQDSATNVLAHETAADADPSNLDIGSTTKQPHAGGHCSIFAAAGTYTVSIRFMTGSGGTLSVKERKLWVWAEGF